MNDTTSLKAKLAHFIDQHDSCRCIAIDGDTLTVQSEAVEQGAVVIVRESIPATLQAVKNWLGY